MNFSLRVLQKTWRPVKLKSGSRTRGWVGFFVKSWFLDNKSKSSSEIKIYLSLSKDHNKIWFLWQKILQDVCGVSELNQPMNSLVLESLSFFCHLNHFIFSSFLTLQVSWNWVAASVFVKEIDCWTLILYYTILRTYNRTLQKWKTTPW